MKHVRYRPCAASPSKVLGGARASALLAQVRVVSLTHSQHHQSSVTQCPPDVAARTRKRCPTLSAGIGDQRESHRLGGGLNQGTFSPRPIPLCASPHLSRPLSTGPLSVTRHCHSQCLHCTPLRSDPLRSWRLRDATSIRQSPFLTSSPPDCVRNGALHFCHLLIHVDAAISSSPVSLS